MARPQKFRHSREALADPQIAAKLGAFVLDIEGLRAKRKQIDLQIAAGYDAVDDAGFEKKFVRKVIALRAKEESVRLDEEEGLEAYEFAVEKGVPLACARRKGDLPAHNPFTGEVIEDEPEADTEFHPPVTTREGHQGDPSPTLGERDLAEVGTGQKRAVLPQEPYTATNHQSVSPSSPDGSASTESAAGKVSDPAQPSPPKQAEPIKAGEGVPPSSPANLSDEEVVPAFLRKSAEPAINERCERPTDCKYAHHPNKVTCSTCSTAWAIAQKKAAA